jgi:hypothetical protein
MNRQVMNYALVVCAWRARRSAPEKGPGTWHSQENGGGQAGSVPFAFRLSLHTRVVVSVLEALRAALARHKGRRGPAGHLEAVGRQGGELSPGPDEVAHPRRDRPRKAVLLKVGDA